MRAKIERCFPRAGTLHRLEKHQGPGTLLFFSVNPSRALHSPIGGLGLACDSVPAIPGSEPTGALPHDAPL